MNCSHIRLILLRSLTCPFLRLIHLLHHFCHRLQTTRPPLPRLFLTLPQLRRQPLVHLLHRLQLQPQTRVPRRLAQQTIQLHSRRLHPFRRLHSLFQPRLHRLRHSLHCLSQLRLLALCSSDLFRLLLHLPLKECKQKYLAHRLREVSHHQAGDGRLCKRVLDSRRHRLVVQLLDGCHAAVERLLTPLQRLQLLRSHDTSSPTFCSDDTCCCREPTS